MGGWGNFNYFSGSHGIVSAVLLLATLILNANLTSAPDVFNKRTSFNDPYVATPEFLKLLSAGYWPAVTDYLWLGAISEIGTGQYTEANFKRSYEFYDLGTKLDPDFYELYEQAGVAFSFFYENAEASLEFLNRGIDRFESGLAPPRFWTHPVTLYIHRAYVYAFLANDWPRARLAYLAAADAPNAPHYLQVAREWMIKEGSEKILATRVLKILIRNTSDEKLKKKYEEKLRKYEP